VGALEPVVCRVIDRALFDRLGNERPRIKISLLEQLAQHLSANLRRANAEAMAFKG
jgi:CRP-like cAMP-binding protein